MRAVAAAITALSIRSAAGLACTNAEIPGLLDQHKSPGDCWSTIVVSGDVRVYDVTRLVNNHEGGSSVIRAMCGRDGTIGFWCWHDLEELQESLDDGDITEICRVPVGAPGRRAAPLDDDDAKNKCATGGTLPTPPAVDILATDVMEHKSTDDCWTSMTQGSNRVVMDISKYVQMHPGGKAVVLSMCGGDSTKAYTGKHPLVYIEQSVTHKFITVLGRLSGDYPTGPPAAESLPLITATVLATHASNADCWGVVGNWVVDMTELLTTHPAGAAMLRCGQDVTASFQNQHADSYITRMTVTGRWDAASAAPAPTKCPKYTTNQAGTCQTVTPTLPTDPTPPTGTTNTTVTVLSQADVASHAVKTDCWLVVRCEVYDCTPFIPYHTGDKQVAAGGTGAVERLCGTVATAAFEGMHPLSYIQLSVDMGAIHKGRYAGCQVDANPVPPSDPATLWYTVLFQSLNSALYPGNTANIKSLTLAIKEVMAAHGTTNLGVVVQNFRIGTAPSRKAATMQAGLKVDIGLELAHIDHLTNAKTFGENYLPTLTWSGSTASIVGTNRLEYAGTAPIPTPAPNSGPPPPAPPVTAAAELPVYTLKQVADHSTVTDCWLAIHGRVYSFVGASKKHPAGSFILLGLCGTECSSGFDLNHPLSYLLPARLDKIGGGQIGTVSVAVAEGAGKKYPPPTPVQQLPSVGIVLLDGSQDFLERHNTLGNCWMALDGDVYDATPMLDKHEGGKGVVAALCGLDATASHYCHHDAEEIQEAIDDYGIRKVGSLASGEPRLPSTCSFDSTTVPSTQIPGAEVVKHSTSQDCWVVLGDNPLMVWDLTAYVTKHTGGSASVLKTCGGNAWKSFTANHNHPGYLTTLAQKGAVIKGTLSEPIPPPSDPGNVRYDPLKMTDVAPHNTPENCWMAVHNYVLDITPFLDQHSGGRAVLVKDCGKDATESFDLAPHPLSYIMMMSQKSFATIKGCIGGCNAGNVAPTAGEGDGTAGQAQTNPTGPDAVATSRSCTANEPQPGSTIIPYSDVQAHSTKGDCWMLLGCGVYDLSGYTHSGGFGTIGPYCGDDGHSAMMGKHPFAYLNTLIQRGAVLKGKAGDVPVGTSIGREVPIGLDEIALHNSPDDCWSCVVGTVYDLTFYMPEHPAGEAVVEPMCGQDSSTYLLMAHGKNVLQGLPKKGTCVNNANQAFREQNIIDACALVGLIILPLMFAGAAMRWMSYRTQDRLMRRPLVKPLAPGFMGDFHNTYLETPVGVVILVLWHLAVAVALIFVWREHYKKYYLPEFATAGMMGRMCVYHVATATFLGTRRWSFSWWLFQISYEKALKAHYIIGSVASVFMLAHGALYIDAFGLSNLPEQTVPSGLFMLVAVIILYPTSVVTNLRIHCYGIFRVAHFLGPGIIIAACLHVISLNVDGNVCPGFYTALLWVTTAAGLWVGDFLHTLYDALCKKSEIIDGPRVLTRDGDAAYIYVRIRKNTVVFPGAWMQVSSFNAKSPLGHPFTTIVRKCGGIDEEQAELEFIWKVLPGSCWTSRLESEIQQCHDPGHFHFFLTGPHGGGIGNLGKMKVIVFITAGVGVTPAASMAPHLQREGKEVVVVWSCRSLALIKQLYEPYFSCLPPENCHIHLTGKGPDADAAVPSHVKTGRPKTAEILTALADSVRPRGVYDIGVFVCGPNVLCSDAMAAADQINESTPSHVHVHSESFQM